MKPAKKKLNRAVGWSLLGLLIVALIVILLFSDWQETLAQLRKITPAQITVLLSLALVNYLARGIRWRIYTGALQLNTGLLQDFRHYFGGFAFTATPGRVGELIRMNWISREKGVPFDKSLPLILGDRAADLVATGVLLALSLVLSTADITGGLPVAVSAIIMAIVVTSPALFHWVITRSWRTVGQAPRLFAKFRRAAKQLGVFAAPRIAVPAFLLGAIGWFAQGYAFYMLIIWFGADLGIWTATAIFLFSMMAGGATGTPGGVGGAEAIMVGLLTIQGVPLEISIPATAIIRATTLWFAVLIGLGVLPWAEKTARRGDFA